MCAKMLDPEFNKGIEVVVLPNLYGDIVTDIAAEHQGGLGTASSSNIGNKYAMFEAIHGTDVYKRQVFWMWISALVGMATAYGETYLGCRYRFKDNRGKWVCGPFIYMEKGLGLSLIHIS